MYSKIWRNYTYSKFLHYMYSSDDHVMMERYDHVTMGRYDFDDGALRSYDRIMTGRYYCTIV